VTVHLLHLIDTDFNIMQQSHGMYAMAKLFVITVIDLFTANGQ